MSSLTLSILILAICVAVGVAAQSAWVLFRERKKSPPLKLDDLPAGAAPSQSQRGFQAGEHRDAADAVDHDLVAADQGGLKPIPVLSDEAFDVRDGPAVPGEPHLALSALDTTQQGEIDQGSSGSATTGSAMLDPQGDLVDQMDAGVQADSSMKPPAEVASPPAMGNVAEHSPTDASAEAVGASPAVTEPAGVRALHDEADCLLELPLQQAMSGDRLLGLTKSIRRAGGKPVGFEGLCGTGWEALRYGATYKRLRAGILLANRQGPLNAMEYSEFTNKVQGLASQLGVPVDFPDMNETLHRARSLDGLLADCDVQLGLSVDCSRALNTSDLSVLAKRLGLFERGNNRYACLSQAAEVIYSVALGDKAQRLQLMFDVPRVLPEHRPWLRMAEAANQAAVMFDGKIIDDAGRELSEQSFRSVAIGLEGRQQALIEAGVPAGSTLALRVFN